MKLPTKLALAFISLSTVAIGTALADSQENQLRLHLRQAEMVQQQHSPSVAIYTSRHEGDRARMTREDRTESARYHARDDRREHVYGTWLKK